MNVIKKFSLRTSTLSSFANKCQSKIFSKEALSESKRQSKKESGSLVGLTTHTDPPVVRFDHTFDDRQT